MPYKKETILPLLEELEKRNDYESAAATLLPAIDFLTGQIIQAPQFSTEETARPIKHFISLLQQPEHWNENDRLVLNLISPAITWNECRETFLATIIPMMDMPGTSSSIVLRFSFFTSFLQQRGCTTEEIGSLLISYSGDGNNFDLAPLKFTPLRKFLQDLIKSAEWQVMDAYQATWKQKGWNSLFFRLLSKGHPDREMEYLENIFGPHGCLPDQLELARALLQHNPSKYELLVENTARRLAARPDYAAALRAYHLLAAQIPGKYAQRLLKAAYRYLEAPEAWQADQEQPYSTMLQGTRPYSEPAGILAVRGLLLDMPAVIPFLNNYMLEKRYLHPDTFRLLAVELKEKAVTLLLTALENDYDARKVLPALALLDGSLYLDQLWPFTLHKLKSVRTLVAVTLAEHPLALPKAGELLLHKKADQRLTAVQILCRLNDPQARLLLQQALHNEVNDDARDLMLETLGGQALPDPDDATAVSRMVAFARKRGKLSRPVEKWLDESALPPLYLLDGSPLTTDMLRFLLYRMSRVKEIRPDVEAKPLLRLIDRSRSGDFAAHLFKIYIHNDGDAKLKYLLTLAALTGDEQLAEELYDAVQHWINTRRLKMAEHGVSALAIQGSGKALRAVEFLSRKYRVRKPGVGAAALAALQNAAAELGIGIHEPDAPRNGSSFSCAIP